MKFATKTIHAGQPSEPETGAVVAPIFQTSTYEQEEPGHDKGFSYSRTNNPTRQRLEAVLAELEGVKYAAAFASGLAAENAVLQAYLRPGDEIIIPRDVYGGTYRILNKVYQPIRRRDSPDRDGRPEGCRSGHQREDETRVDRIAHESAASDQRHRGHQPNWRMRAARSWWSTTRLPRPVSSSRSSWARTSWSTA